jgi:hypothetical protein
MQLEHLQLQALHLWFAIKQEKSKSPLQPVSLFPGQFL